jgi:hypothetical protein
MTIVSDAHSLNNRQFDLILSEFDSGRVGSGQTSDRVGSGQTSVRVGSGQKILTDCKFYTIQIVGLDEIMLLLLWILKEFV